MDDRDGAGGLSASQDRGEIVLHRRSKFQRVVGMVLGEENGTMKKEKSKQKQPHTPHTPQPASQHPIHLAVHTS